MKKSFFIMFGILIAGAAHSQTYSTVSTFAGSGTQGLLDAPLANAQFSDPRSIVEDPATGTLYITDTYGNEIRRIRNGVVTTLAGNGTQGDVDAQGSNARLKAPSGIKFYNGYIYITDNGNHKIKRIDTLGNVTTIAGTGSVGTTDGSALSAKFNNPTELAIDASGVIYVADDLNHSIRMISNNQVSTIAGTPGSAGDQIGPALSAKFDHPVSIAVNPQGTMIYIADMVNNKIKLLQNGTVSTLAGSGSIGFIDGTGNAAEMNYPGELSWDLYGNLLFTDGNHAVRRMTPGGTVTTIAGTGSSGFNNGPIATATFNIAAGSCVTGNGTMYVGDRMNYVIRMISVADVGIQTYSDNDHLDIYPVPAENDLHISYNGLPALKTLRIFETEGKLVREIAIPDGSETIIISVADLPAGLYIIEADAENKIIRSEFTRR